MSQPAWLRPGLGPLLLIAATASGLAIGTLPPALLLALQLLWVPVLAYAYVQLWPVQGAVLAQQWREGVNQAIDWLYVQPARALGLTRMPEGLQLCLLIGLAIACGAGFAFVRAERVGVAVLATLLALPALRLGVWWLNDPVHVLLLALISAPTVALQRELLNVPVDTAQLLFFLAVALYLFRWVFTQWEGLSRGAEPLRFHKPTLIALLVFITVTGAGFFIAARTDDWGKEWLKWLQVLAFYLIIANTRDPRERALVIGAVLLGAALQGAMGINQFLTGAGAPDHFAISKGRFFRAFGALQQPNPFGGFMGMSWPLALMTALMLMLDKPISLREVLKLRSLAELRNRVVTDRPRNLLLGVLALIVVALGLAGVVMSWSRGAWLAAAIAAGLMLWLASRRMLLTLGIVGMLAALAFALDLPALLPATMRERLFGFLALTFSANFDVRNIELTVENYPTVERLAHWQAAISMIGKYWLTGVGLGNFNAAFVNHTTLKWPVALGHAHNIYLNFFAETGIFGLLSYLAFWGLVTVRAARLALGRKRGSWLALGIFAAFVHMHVHHMVDNLIVSNLWMFMGVYLGLLDQSATLESLDQ